MAMDKEKLLAYFQDHYLSRQEVLFKLPLNYSIESFWPELLQRRKAQATVLPLYNALGMPYWYVLTPKMVSASERLCEEAINQEKVFDPYRAEMTSAMTEEMFFTSFVEGAQIPLQAAMDFLQRGTEPESIQEQMIWNNRRAWAEMIGAIYHPLDEPFIKGLAYMLTEEMDGCAADYRQTDSHMIAAMNDEPYDVPPAYCIPERMGQYYEFLRFGETHPLIKASAAQAYLLVMRPFPEGNERLSRMISSAVLLRSGYDFFRDISISAVIAKENYRYYKSMCEIIRTENGGDMTYFIEYFLELLVRAVDQRRERIHRREQEALAREREQAVIPLGNTPVMITPLSEVDDDPPFDEDPDEEKEEPIVAKKKEKYPMEPPIDMMPIEGFLAAVDKMKKSPSSKARTLPGKIRHMIDSGCSVFTVGQWADQMNMERKDADQECRYIYQKGLVDRDKSGAIMRYSFRYLQNGASPREEEEQEEIAQQVKTDESPPTYDRFLNRVRQYEQNDRLYIQLAGRFFRRLIETGETTFTSQQLIEYAGMDRNQAKDLCTALIRGQFVVNATPEKKPALYRITGDTERIPVPENTHKPAVKKINPDFWERIKSMDDSKSDMIRRTAEVIRECLKKGITTFKRTDWPDISGLSKERSNDSCDYMLSRGLAKNIAMTSKGAVYVFLNQETENGEEDFSSIPDDEIITKLRGMVKSDSDRDQRIGKYLLNMIKDGRKSFTAAEFGKAYGISSWIYGNDLRRAVNTGLVRKEFAGPGTTSHVKYVLCRQIQKGVRCDDLTAAQKRLISCAYSKYGNREFTVEDCARLLNQQTSTTYFHLNNLAEKEIIAQRGKVGQMNQYSVLVTPQSNPECFLKETASNSTVSSGVKEAAVPRVAAAM